MKKFKVLMLNIFKTKIFFLFSAVILFIFFAHINFALADTCSCSTGTTKVTLGSYGLEDACRTDCQTKGYANYTYGTAAAKPVTTTVAPSNPTNLGGGCYCDGTYIGNFGVESGCKTDCFNRKTLNYNYQNTGNKATGYTAPATSSPTATSPTTSNSSSGGLVYTPMEKIPGFPTTGDFPSYIMAVYNFGLWTVGLAALLMISIGGFIYITSAGNNSQTGKAKAIITDAIIGIIMALTSYILLNTINPSLVHLTTISGTSTGTGGTGGTGTGGTGGTGTGGTGGTGTGGTGNGTCAPATVGDCSVNNLQNTCFSSNTNKWSTICGQESNGGDPAKESGTDLCSDGSSFSIGLFQINMITSASSIGCNGSAIFNTSNSGGAPECAKYTGSGGQGACLACTTNSKGVGYCSKWNCTVKNSAQYDNCKKQLQNGATNIQIACSLSSNGSSTGPWQTTAKACGF